MRMQTILCSIAITIGLALLAGPVFSKDDGAGHSDPAATAPATGASARPAKPASGDADRDGQSQDGRSSMRVAPIFRDVTEADIADILAFVDENMPWMRPELDRTRTASPDQFRQVCRHLRYEVAQLKDLRKRDPEGFRKAIEEKQLKFRAQDLANKARAATDQAERDGLVEELRNVIDKLFDVEVAAREAQIAQLEGRIEALRQELKTRAANRQQIVKARLDDMLKGKDDMLKGKKDGEHKYRPDSRPPDKGERHEKTEKSE
jgi:polyhydroxyalkanoate synthesis regulator phasin